MGTDPMTWAYAGSLDRKNHGVTQHIAHASPRRLVGFDTFFFESGVKYEVPLSLATPV